MSSDAGTGSQSQDAESDFVSPITFVRLTGLPMSTVRRYLDDGRLPKVQSGGPQSRVLIPRSEVERFLHAPRLRAVVRHAELSADVTVAVLDSTGLFPPTPDRQTRATLPAGALLELAAVLQLGVWERKGLRPYLRNDLPTFREAASDLAARISEDPDAMKDRGAATLHRRVLGFYLERFAWEGPELLGTDVVVSDVDEDDFIDVLAEFVWTHRHELERSVLGESQQ